MVVRQAVENHGLEAVCLPQPEQEITGPPCCCDLLGLAVTHVPPGSLWFTLNGHLNTVAAATLNHAAGVVLCGGFQWPPEAVEAAGVHGVNLLSSPLPSFEAARSGGF